MLNKPLLLILLSGTLLAQKPALIPYRKGKLWGIVDSNMKMRIQPLYQSITFFNRHLGSACRANTEESVCELFNIRGESLGIFSDVQTHNDGFVHVVKGNSPPQYWGLYDSLGNVVVPPIYGYVGDVHEGLVEVKKDGKSGFFDTQGKQVIPFRYTNVQPFSYGRAWIFNDSGNVLRRGSIDKSGNETWFDMTGMVVAALEEDHVSFSKSGGNGVMDKRGNILIPAICREIDNLHNGLFACRMENDLKAVWKNGKQVTPAKYKEVYPDGTGYYKVTSGGRMGYLDTNGKEIIPPVFQLAQAQRNGMFLVADKGKSGIYSRTGKKIADPIYDQVDLSKRYSPVMQNGKWALMDSTGKLLTEFRYDQLSVIEYDTFCRICVRFDGAFGFIDEKGREITFFYYDQCPYLLGKNLVASCGGRFGVMDTSGRIILPFAYDNLHAIKTGKWLLEQDRRSLLADSTGMVQVLPMRVEYLSDFGKGLLIGKSKKGEIYLFSEDGKKLIAAFERAPYVQLQPEGTIIVEKTKGKFGVIDRTGKEIVPAIYDHILAHGIPLPPDYHGPMWSVIKNGKGNTLLHLDGTYYGED